MTKRLTKNQMGYTAQAYEDIAEDVNEKLRKEVSSFITDLVALSTGNMPATQKWQESYQKKLSQIFQYAKEDQTEKLEKELQALRGEL